MKLILKFAFSVSLTIILLEGLFSALCWVRYGTLRPSRIAELQDGNVYQHQCGNQSFAELVRPHPYLGITPREDHRSSLPGWRDNIVENFPIEKPSEYTVLLVGGSVAELMGCAHDEKGSFLEQALERNLGRPVRVLNAAVGATTQPRHTIAVMLYVDRVDAVLCLDGFNESSRFRGGHSTLETPGGWFQDLNPLLCGGFDRIGKAWLSNRLGCLSERSGSRTAIFLSSVVRSDLASSSAVPEQRTEQLPSEWSAERCIEFNLGRYRRYFEMSRQLCGPKPYRHFIQPCPAIGKRLTAEEVRCVGDLSYRDAYERMAKSMVEAGAVSLLDAYEGIEGTVYVDAVHCGGNSEGYRILAERMAEGLRPDSHSLTAAPNQPSTK